MSRNLVLFSLLVGVLVCGTIRAADPARPNILFILTDDQAPTALGASGNAEIKTPNLDRLFRQGVTLRNSFVATPVCSPSRAELMTSRYGSEVGIFDWINPRAEKDHGLSDRFVTWPQLLQQAGYKTGLVGKWHLGTAAEFHPTKRGYGYFAGFAEGGTRVVDPVLEIDGESQKMKGLTTDLLTDYALKFIEGNKQRPFALSVHYRAPHAPWLPVAAEDWAPYESLDPTLPDPDFPLLDTKRVKKMTREYYASTSGVDRNVGRLLSLLDSLQLADNTVVVFTSDHGYHTGHHGLWYKGNAHWMLTKLPPKKWENIPPLRRPNMYDQALRTPTVVRWPAGVKSDLHELPQTISNVDWMPTLLAIAGVPIPNNTTLHGRDFSPLLRGEKVEWQNELYAEYSMRHGAKTEMRALRTPEWKLMIDFAHQGRVELYDLKNDPKENQNLAESTEPKIVEMKTKLTLRLEQRMKALQTGR